MATETNIESNTPLVHMRVEIETAASGRRGTSSVTLNILPGQEHLIPNALMKDAYSAIAEIQARLGDALYTEIQRRDALDAGTQTLVKEAAPEVETTPVVEKRAATVKARAEATATPIPSLADRVKVINVAGPAPVQEVEIDDADDESEEEPVLIAPQLATLPSAMDFFKANNG